MPSQDTVSHFDHGYAWVVSFTVFAWNLIVCVIFKTFGVLHIQLEELFGHGAFRTSLVAFVMSLCWIVFSPPSGYLAYRWPTRINIIVGGLLASGIFFRLLIYSTKATKWFRIALNVHGFTILLHSYWNSFETYWRFLVIWPKALVR